MVRIGGACQRHFGRQALMRHIRPEHPLDVDYPGGRLNPFKVEPADPVDVVEDRRKLGAHGFDLLLGQPEAGQAGNMQNFFTLDHGS